MTAIATANEERRTDGAALVAAAVTVLLWASAFVGIRSAGRSFAPGALSLARLLVAVAALGAIGYATGERLPGRVQRRAMASGEDFEERIGGSVPAARGRRVVPTIIAVRP